MVAKTILQQILEEKKSRPTVIFDLDSTLFNVSYRSSLILKHFSEEDFIRKTYPEIIPQLANVKVQASDWGLKEAVVRAQVKAPAEFFEELKKYWRKHFFTSEYLQADKPYKGAVEYVNQIHQSGAKLIYLTGRDAPNMRAGTIASLCHYQFPLDSDDYLVMKPTKTGIEDEDFKDKWIRENKDQRTSNWFFENEPLIIQKVRVSSPEVRIVWIRTTHSRRATEPHDLPILVGDFSID